MAQDAPIGQEVQLLDALLLLALEKLPAMHGNAAAAPSGQYDPAVQRSQAVLAATL